MQVLTVLTLVWAGILVLALAASLITILVDLLRVRRALAEIGEALSEVRRKTGALQAPLELFEEAARDSAAELAAACKALHRAEHRLAGPPADLPGAATAEGA